MKNMEELKELIREDMKEGEVVLWAGRPDGIKLLDAPYQSSIIIRWIICLIIIGIAVWYRFIYYPSAANDSINANVVMLVLVAIAAVIALIPVKDLSALKKKCFYFITNQRALLLVMGSSRYIKEKSYADVTEITCDRFAENRGNIYIGKKLKNSAKKARVGILTRPNEEDKNRPLVFHGVVNPEEVVRVFPVQEN